MLYEMRCDRSLLCVVCVFSVFSLLAVTLHNPVAEMQSKVR